jgi:hypothetical protein
MLSRGDSIQSRVADMLMPTLFLEPEVEEEAEEESSHVLHVERMDTNHLSVQKRKWRGEAHITEAQRRDVEDEDTEVEVTNGAQSSFDTRERGGGHSSEN